MGVPSCSVDHDAKACFAHRASCAHIARALQEHPQTYLDATWHAVGSVFLRLGKVVCDQEAPNLEYVTMSEGAHLHAKLADIVHVWPGPGSVAPVKGDGSCGKAVWVFIEGTDECPCSRYSIYRIPAVHVHVTTVLT
jgi:hypothetical protein